MTPEVGSPGEIAFAEMRVVAKALASLGRRAVLTEIVAASGLPKASVMRRLRGGSSPLPTVPKYFACLRPVARQAPSVWSLTAAGVELAAG